jgi:hypothetical protein
VKTVIELPCSVGDTVWARSWCYGEAGNWKPLVVTNLTVTVNKKGNWTKKFRAMKLVNGQASVPSLEFGIDDIGNTVLLEEPNE